MTDDEQFLGDGPGEWKERNPSAEEFFSTEDPSVDPDGVGGSEARRTDGQEAGGSEATEADEYLDRMCWLMADNAQNFWPIEETAQNCVDSIYDDSEDIEVQMAKERSSHSRAVIESARYFDDLVTHGYDPVMRAKRYVREDDLDLPELGFEWYETMGLHSDKIDSL